MSSQNEVNDFKEKNTEAATVAVTKILTDDIEYCDNFYTRCEQRNSINFVCL